MPQRAPSGAPRSEDGHASTVAFKAQYVDSKICSMFCTPRSAFPLKVQLRTGSIGRDGLASSLDFAPLNILQVHQPWFLGTLHCRCYPHKFEDLIQAAM